MDQPQQPQQPPPPDPSCRRIQVSREKRPLHFFVTLSKKFLTTDEVIELSGLGLAVTTVVTIAEILKAAGLVSIERKSIQKHSLPSNTLSQLSLTLYLPLVIKTSLVEPHPEANSTAPKAKIQIWIRKTPQFDTLITNHNLQHHHPRQAAQTPTHLEAGNTNPTLTHPQQPLPTSTSPAPTTTENNSDTPLHSNSWLSSTLHANLYLFSAFVTPFSFVNATQTLYLSFATLLLFLPRPSVLFTRYSSGKPTARLLNNAFHVPRRLVDSCLNRTSSQRSKRCNEGPNILLTSAVEDNSSVQTYGYFLLPHPYLPVDHTWRAVQSANSGYSRCQIALK